MKYRVGDFISVNKRFGEVLAIYEDLYEIAFFDSNYDLFINDRSYCQENEVAQAEFVDLVLWAVKYYEKQGKAA